MALDLESIKQSALDKYRSKHPEVGDSSIRDDLAISVIEALVEAIQSDLEADLTAAALTAPPNGGPVLPTQVPPGSFK